MFIGGRGPARECSKQSEEAWSRSSGGRGFAEHA